MLDRRTGISAQALSRITSQMPSTSFTAPRQDAMS
jgi:hypothetical protein